MLKIEKYTSNYKSEWDDFVSKSINGTFLFYRDYMDYHSDRFIDHSLMLYKSDKLIALLPANIVDDIIYSHQGLTYGSLILSAKYHYQDLVQYFNCINKYLSQKKIIELIIKVPPYFYSRNLAQEQSLLFQRNEHTSTKTVLGAAIFTPGFSFPKLNLSKTKLKIYTMESTSDFTEYWQLLEFSLRERYNSSPVHSLNEIQSLANRFPDNIKLHVFRNKLNSNIEAGVVLFICNEVVKAQYISSSPQGRKNRVSDALYYSIINHYKDKCLFIDLGTCEEDNNSINTTLLNAKEKFGAKSFPIFNQQISTSRSFIL